ncbi:MAG TPA: hypothetical protein VGC10_08075, partial [Sphingomonas sp.]
MLKTPSGTPAGLTPADPIDGSEPATRRQTIRIYVAVVLVGVAGIAIASVKAIIIGTYVHDFGTSAPVAGYLLSVEMVAATLGVIISTLVGGRSALAAALVAIFVGDTGTGLASVVTTLFAWQVLAGLGHGFALGRMGQGIATVEHPQRLSGCYMIGYLALSSVNSFLLPNTKALLGPHALFFTLALTGPFALLALRWFPTINPRGARGVKGVGKPIGFVLTV